jgi:CDP-diacylglycerol--glycerol-3-phosphate 3-phosphatidyltransferase
MLRHVPNALTTSRLLLAVVFFAMLSLYQYEGRGDPTLLNWALLIYLVALFTDFLDGYLARRWKMESAFGRVVDPFVDKVLVLGSFIFFAGKNFVIPETLQAGGGPQMVGKQITGVAPAMVVIILARELLVTTLRGVSEGEGKAFGAAFSGKFKMVVQSITILVILIYVNYLDWWKGWKDSATMVRDIFIWVTLVVTVWSGLLYIGRAVALYRARD